MHAGSLWLWQQMAASIRHAAATLLALKDQSATSQEVRLWREIDHSYKKESTMLTSDWRNTLYVCQSDTESTDSEFDGIT